MLELRKSLVRGGNLNPHRVERAGNNASAPVLCGVTNLDGFISQGPGGEETPRDVAKDTPIPVACAGQENGVRPRVVHRQLPKS